MIDKWNAFVDKDLVIEQTASGKLDGLTFAVKDVFAIEDYTSGAGNPDWLRTHDPAKQHAPAIKRLLNHGAKLKGTTQTDELMYSLNGENFHYGTPMNPEAPGHIPGGSSSGSAVAVSSGLVDFSLGTDTGGSVRIPSSYCGIYGFRPTFGTVPIEGVIPLAKSFDTVGWMARQPKLLLDVGHILIEGQSGKGNFNKIFLGKDAWELLDKENKETILAYISSVEERMEDSEWIHISEEGLAEWANTFRIIQGIEIWEEHGEWIRKENPTFGPGIAERFHWTSTLKKSENKSRYDLREKIRESLSNLLGEEGLLVIPTAPGAAPLVHLHGEKAEQYRAKTMQLSCIAGLAGLPQVTLPLTKVNGLPIGLSFIANHNQDLKLLSFVKEFF
ncbi:MULTISPECIES: amidase [Metabacillus]|uniref:Amidase n=2 Tax=Metabacillus TaxID=2675233 RepID=A0A179SRP9_9BACI|nr:MULTISPECIES: amidase [Metabacillus]OAS83978.1 amidase [Metabacillus litoralis]QNF30940.1 amidase [Metabacillus sp. KUDC1714]